MESWGTIHLRELPEDWEARVQRLVFEAFVIHVSTAWELYVDAVTGGRNKRKFIESFSGLSPLLKEFRGTRNCLMHNDGAANQKYFDESGLACRVVKTGDFLPLDWRYSYDRTLAVLNAAEQGGNGGRP